MPKGKGYGAGNHQPKMPTTQPMDPNRSLDPLQKKPVDLNNSEQKKLRKLLDR